MILVLNFLVNLSKITNNFLKYKTHLGCPGGVGLGPWSVLLSRSQL